MLVCMDPSSPPVKRTLHLLKTPDILLANDNRLLGNYSFINISARLDRAALPIPPQAIFGQNLEFMGKARSFYTRSSFWAKPNETLRCQTSALLVSPHPQAVS